MTSRADLQKGTPGSFALMHGPKYLENINKKLEIEKKRFSLSADVNDFFSELHLG